MTSGANMKPSSFESIKARHEKLHHWHSFDEVSDFDIDEGPGDFAQAHRDREWLIEEVERLQRQINRLLTRKG